MIHTFHLERFSIFREAYHCLSLNASDLQSSGDGASIEDFMNGLPDMRIDVLLLDMDVNADFDQPLADCLQVCQTLKETRREVQVVLHSPFKHSLWLEKFIDAGVLGFVSKYSNFDRLLHAFHEVMKGELYVCPVISAQFSNFEEYQRNRKVRLKSKFPGFSPRETEVLELLIQGKSTRQIAAKLFLSERTVETHRKNLTNKVQVKTTAELVNFVSSRRLV